MNRQYLYLVHFQPDLLKKHTAQKKLDAEDGVQTSVFKKRYPGMRVEADHRLSTGWITEILQEYGTVGAVEEYTYTTDPAALPARPLNDEEAETLEKKLRGAYTAASGFWGIVFLAFCVIQVFWGLKTENLVFLGIGGVFFGLFLASMFRRKKRKKEADAMVFSRSDWSRIDGTCCNTWTESHEEWITNADGEDERQTYTDYYYEIAAGGLAFAHTFDGVAEIGDAKMFYFNRNTGEVR